MEQESVKIDVATTEADCEIVQLSSPSLPKSISLLRQKAMDFAATSPLSSEDLMDLELAIGEACSNAVRHGSPDGKLGEVCVRYMMKENALVVEISDHGCGFDPELVPPPVPEQMAEGGLGIYLMRKLVDVVEFEFDAGTTVRLTKNLRATSGILRAAPGMQLSARAESDKSS